MKMALIKRELLPAVKAMSHELVTWSVGDDDVLRVETSDRWGAWTWEIVLVDQPHWSGWRVERCDLQRGDLTVPYGAHIQWSSLAPLMKDVAQGLVKHTLPAAEKAAAQVAQLSLLDARGGC
jgi:hypothetical protein